MTLEPGSHVDSYEVLEVLGEGAFGISYRVRDRALSLQFALKEYFPRGLAQRGPDGQVLAADGQDAAFTQGLARFLEEGQTLARLDHPNLARVLRHFSGQGTAYLLMPYYEGRTLHDLLLRDGTFSPAEIDALMQPLLDALEYLQGSQVVHGDIKPSNIIVSPAGEPRLLDFGAARVTGAGTGRAATLFGSAGYAAPEQSGTGVDVTSATDIYGLAATLYRLITGEIPVSSTQRSTASESSAQGRQQDPLLPLAGRASLDAFSPAFLRAVDQGLALRRAARPRDIEHWRHALGQASAAPSRLKPSAEDKSERVLLPQVLGWLVILTLLGLAGWLLLGTPEPEREPVPAQPGSLPATSLAEDDSSWAQAVRADTAAGFRAYLEAFPSGAHAPAAREQLAAFDAQRWEAIAASGSSADFERYLEDFPDGQFVVEARARAARSREAEALALAEEQAAKEREQQRVALEQAARDEAAWQSARELDEKAGYRAYLQAHSRGRYVAEALAAIDRLTLDPGKRFRDCPGCPEMIVLPPGNFTQGAADDDPLARSNERPARQVRLARPFAIGTREVTFAQWELCVSAGSCRAQVVDNGWGRDKRPVMLVNWVDAQDYVAWLSKKTGAVYGLPSESQWEYAARAGETGPWPSGSPSRLCTVANVAGSESGFAWQHGACADPFSVGTAPVAYFKPNSMGVYDMVGNVAEWTADCMNLSYLDAPADGSVWERGLCSSRVTRGGSWFSGSQESRLSARFALRSGERNDFTGFRVVREVNE